MGYRNHIQHIHNNNISLFIHAICQQYTSMIFNVIKAQRAFGHSVIIMSVKKQLVNTDSELDKLQTTVTLDAKRF